MTITVEVSGFDVIERKLNGIKGAWRGERGRVYTDISDIGELSTILNFAELGRPTWPPRKHPQSWPPLQKTREMGSMALASWEPNLWKHLKIKHVLDIISTFYAKYQQYGTRTIAARPFVQLLPAEVQQVRDAIRKPFISQQ